MRHNPIVCACFILLFTPTLCLIMSGLKSQTYNLITTVWIREPDLSENKKSSCNVFCTLTSKCMHLHGRKKSKTFNNHGKNIFFIMRTRGSFFFISLTWASRSHDGKGTFSWILNVFHCFRPCECMRKHACAGQNTHHIICVKCLYQEVLYQRSWRSWLPVQLWWPFESWACTLSLLRWPKVELQTRNSSPSPWSTPHLKKTKIGLKNINSGQFSIPMEDV